MDTGHVIGIDIGGTHFRIGAVGTDGTIREADVIPSRFIGSASRPLGAIADAVKEYVLKAGLTNIICVSIGLPATVDRERKKVYSVPNIISADNKHVLDNLNIVDGLGQYLDFPVLLNKDVNNLLAYDMFMHDLYDKEIVVACYIGTGFGGAIYISGQFLMGKHGVANEIGHIPYYKGQEYCSCGKKACTECYASGRALKQLQERYYPDTFIGDIFLKHGAEAPLMEFVEACALPIATQANIMDPDCIIIGGGVADMPGFPKEELLRQVVANTRHPLPANDLTIMFSTQRPNMGVVGAAIYAITQMSIETNDAFGRELKRNIEARP